MSTKKSNPGSTPAQPPNKGNAVLSVLILIIGIIFIVLWRRDTLPNGIVLICGLAFAIPSLFSIIGSFFNFSRYERSATSKAVELVCGIGGLMLGICIIFLPDVFRRLLFYPFGALIIAGGLYQIYTLARKNRPVDYPGWLLAVPIVLITTGVVIICLDSLHTHKSENLLVLITGICGVLFGIDGLFLSGVARCGRKNPATKAEVTPAPSGKPEHPAPAETDKPAKADEPAKAPDQATPSSPEGHTGA